MKIKSLSFLVIIISCCNVVFAQIPTGQGVGSAARGFSDSRRKNAINRKVTSKRVKRPALDAPVMLKLPGDKDKIFVKNIIIQQMLSAKEFIPQNELNELIRPYLKRDVRFVEIQELINRTSTAYEQKGLRCYLPQQDLSNDLLYLNLVPEPHE